MKNAIKLFILTAVALSFASCTQKSLEERHVASVSPTFTAGVSTKADGIYWTQDQIGITVVGAEASNMAADYQNVGYATTADGVTSATFDPINEEIQFEDSEETVTFTAYAPYVAGTDINVLPGDEGIFTANTEAQSTAADQTALDYMYAGAATGSEDSPVVTFTFNHVMTQLTITFIAGEGVEDTDVENGIYALDGIIHDGAFDVKYGSENEGTAYTTGTDADADWSLNENWYLAEATTYACVLFPQTPETMTLSAVVNGVTYNDVDLLASIENGQLEAGNSYNYTVTVTASELTITGCTINDWINHNYEISVGGGEGDNEGEGDGTADYTTNVTWVTDADGKSWDYTATINGSEESYEILKLGSGSAVGSATCTIPAGSTGFGFYVVAWNGKSDVPYQVTIGDEVYSGTDYLCQGNSGFSGSGSSYDLVDVTDDIYKLIEFSALESDTVVTVETTSTSPDARAGFFGVKYFPTDLSLGDGDGDNEGGETGELTGDGTVENPYTVADVLAIFDAGAETDSDVYVKGIVSEVGSLNSSYGELTYYISDDGTTTDQFEIYQGFGLGGEKITDTSYLSVGDDVVVCGPLKNYYGTYEMTYTNYIYSLNGVTAGEGGEDEPGEENEKYVSNLENDWTLTTNSYKETASIDGYTYTILRVGKSSSPYLGEAGNTLPAGTTGIAFYCIAWNNKGPAPFTVKVGDVEYSGDDYQATAHSGLSGNTTPYTIDDLSEDDYWTIEFDSALTEETAITVETTSTSYPRVAFIGFKYLTD